MKKNDNKRKFSFLLISLMFGVSCFAAGVEEAGTDEGFKPKFRTGLLLQTYVGSQQNGYGSGEDVKGVNGDIISDSWKFNSTLRRTRVMMDVSLTKNDYLFAQTELTGYDAASKSFKLRFLDVQFDHTFNEHLIVTAGKFLATYNRDNMQSAGALMANDYAYYTPTIDRDEVFRNDASRDFGVGIGGGFLKNKLIYHLSAFTGKRDFAGQDDSPLRVIGRVEYNFFDNDKYWGTNLGQGKTFTIAGGFDTQGTFVDGGVDLFLDYPVTSAGSVTVNAAFSYITGGNDLSSKYSFASLIPTQTVQLLEVGYYFKSCKLQPWIRYERQGVNSESNQTGGIGNAAFDKLYSATVLGGGLNYFFNGHNTNLKLSYTSINRGVQQASVVSKTYGQVWLLLQVRFF
jgi:hypothetical protein